jgi:DNA-binding response OmpR family regulator
LASSLDVFIVEDDQLLASALSVQVEMLGYRVIGLADTAADAVAGVTARKPDIVIMDVNLGSGGSGLEAAESIRRRHGLPIIFYTAYNDDAFRDRVATLENVQILQKPVSEDSLEAGLSAASHAARHRGSGHLIALP